MITAPAQYQNFPRWLRSIGTQAEPEPQPRDPTSLTEAAESLIERLAPRAGQAVLLCGDNVSLLARAMRAGGARVVIATGCPAAQQRASRRNPDCEVVLRGKDPAESVGQRGPFDAVVIWDGVGASLNRWLADVGQVPGAVWLNMPATGWERRERPVDVAEAVPNCLLQRPAEPPAERNDVPLLFHVHIPKNGGSSVNDVLFENFGYRYVPIYKHDPWERQGTADIAEMIETRPHALASGSHTLREFPASVAGRPILYFTFLRRPLYRHLSYFRYSKKHYHTFSEEHRKSLPKNFMEMTPLDYLRFVDDLFKRGYGWGQLSHFSAKLSAQEAIETLDGFFCVGLVEQMERGLRLLSRQCEAAGVHLPVIDMPQRANTTEDLYDSARVTADIEKLADGLLTEEESLYCWAASRFERLCLSWGV